MRTKEEEKKVMGKLFRLPVSVALVSEGRGKTVPGVKCVDCCARAGLLPDGSTIDYPRV